MVEEKILNLVTQESVLVELWKNLVKDYDITSSRKRNNVRFRHAFATCVRVHSDLSLMAIGKLLGKDHATVLHAMKQHEMNYLYDATYRKIYEDITKYVEKALDQYRLNDIKDLTQISSISADAALQMKNRLLNRQIQDLKKEIHLIQERHELELKRLSKFTKQLTKERDELEDRLADFKRRYML